MDGKTPATGTGWNTYLPSTSSSPPCWLQPPSQPARGGGRKPRHKSSFGLESIKPENLEKLTNAAAQKPEKQALIG